LPSDRLVRAKGKYSTFPERRRIVLGHIGQKKCGVRVSLVDTHSRDWNSDPIETPVGVQSLWQEDEHFFFGRPVQDELFVIMTFGELIEIVDDHVPSGSK
jgi:hypothetical protein